MKYYIGVGYMCLLRYTLKKVFLQKFGFGHYLCHNSQTLTDV